jgi:hypothetical protein
MGMTRLDEPSLTADTSDAGFAIPDPGTPGKHTFPKYIGGGGVHESFLLIRSHLASTLTQCTWADSNSRYFGSACSQESPSLIRPPLVTRWEVGGGPDLAEAVVHDVCCYCVCSRSYCVCSRADTISVIHIVKLSFLVC